MRGRAGLFRETDAIYSDPERVARAAGQGWGRGPGGAPPEPEAVGRGEQRRGRQAAPGSASSAGVGEQRRGRRAAPGSASSAGVGEQRRGRRAAPGSARTRAAGPTRQHLTMVYKAPLRGLGAVPRWVTQVGMPHGKNYQSLSSGSLRVIPSVRNFFL